MSPARLLRAVRGILNFLFLARYPVHTSETLDCLDAALKQFHDNRDIFIDLGVRAHFNFPRFILLDIINGLLSYLVQQTTILTEYTERLHIDLAKDAYRATNMKDEYPQMTTWLERREKVLRHDKFLRRQISGSDSDPPISRPPFLVQPRELKMAKHHQPEV